MHRCLLPVLLLLAACAGPDAVDPGEPGLPVPDGAQEATVVRVVDGDTVQLEGVGDGPLRDGERTRVRVLLVDTPEIHTEQECFGQEAFDRARELLPEGSTVRVEADEDLYDRYDRTLLHVWTSAGVNVGEALLARASPRCSWCARTSGTSTRSTRPSAPPRTTRSACGASAPRPRPARAGSPAGWWR